MEQLFDNILSKKQKSANQQEIDAGRNLIRKIKFAIV